VYIFIVQSIEEEILEPSTEKDWIQYDKQDQQGKAAFNERNPHMIVTIGTTMGYQADHNCYLKQPTTQNRKI
jgi:hypothetical protein